MLLHGEGLEGGSWGVPGVLTIPACPGQQRGAPLRHRYGHSDGPQAQNHLRAAHVEHGVCSSGCSPPQVRAEQGTWDVGAGGTPPPWHSALGWLRERCAIPCREPKKLLNHFSLSCPPGTDSPMLFAGQWLVCSSVGQRPWQRACRSLVTSTPAWTPGRSNSTSTRKTFKWQRGWCPSEQGP